MPVFNEVYQVPLYPGGYWHAGVSEGILPTFHSQQGLSLYIVLQYRYSSNSERPNLLLCVIRCRRVFPKSPRHPTFSGSYRTVTTIAYVHTQTDVASLLYSKSPAPAHAQSSLKRAILHYITLLPSLRDVFPIVSQFSLIVP